MQNKIYLFNSADVNNIEELDINLNGNNKKIL